MCKYLSLIQANFTVGNDFKHTTLANHYGIDLLKKTNDKKYQIDIANSQKEIHDLNYLNWEIISEIFEISNAKTILATESTFSQMAAIFGNVRDYRCFGFENGITALGR